MISSPKKYKKLKVECTCTESKKLKASNSLTLVNKVLPSEVLPISPSNNIQS